MKYASILSLCFVVLLDVIHVQSFSIRCTKPLGVRSMARIERLERDTSVQAMRDGDIFDTAMYQPLTSLINQHHSLLLSDEAVQASGYSNLSLYFTLALYVLTLPGLFSLVTRSVKVKEAQVTYDLPGPANPTAKPLRQVAAEIMAYFKALNYQVDAAEEVITFKGVMGRSNSQAAFLTFCTFMGLGSLGLVLSILLPDIGGKAYLLTLLSPYAGIYYWKNAQRVDTVKVKMETSDDEQITSIIAQGGKDDLERFSKALQLPEKGKVYIKGLFESDSEQFPSSPIAMAAVDVGSEGTKE